MLGVAKMLRNPADQPSCLLCLPHSFARAPQICQCHLGVFTRKNYAIGARLKCRQRCITDSFRRAPAMSLLGRNIDVDSWPEKSLCSCKTFARAFGFARNVISREPGERNFSQRLLLLVQHAVVEFQEFLPWNIAIERAAHVANVVGQALSATVGVDYDLQKI